MPKLIKYMKQRSKIKIVNNGSLSNLVVHTVPIEVKCNLLVVPVKLIMPSFSLKSHTSQIKTPVCKSGSTSRLHTSDSFPSRSLW